MTQFTLKIIALVFMLMDHAVKVVLSAGTLAPVVGPEGEALIRSIMLTLGRAAFPIFAWFTAEGCRKTADLRKYCLRLFLFGVISEVPFQLASTMCCLQCFWQLLGFTLEGFWKSVVCTESLHGLFPQLRRYGWGGFFIQTTMPGALA